MNIDKPLWNNKKQLTQLLCYINKIMNIHIIPDGVTTHGQKHIVEPHNFVKGVNRRIIS